MNHENVDDAQEQRNKDPGYRAQLKDHQKRSTPPKTIEPPNNTLVQRCVDLALQKKYTEVFDMLADKYDVPPPKISNDLMSHPRAYAFYDTTKRTIVYMPEDMVGLETCIMTIFAGFFMHMSHHNDWRYDDDDLVKSLNTELDTVSDLATDAVDLINLK